MRHLELNLAAETLLIEVESFFAITVKVQIWIDLHDSLLRFQFSWNIVALVLHQLCSVHLILNTGSVQIASFIHLANFCLAIACYIEKFLYKLNRFFF